MQLKKVSKIYTVIGIICIVLSLPAIAQSDALKRVLVNQAGYNKGESKRLVAWGISDGTPFTIEGAVTGRVLYKGIISGYSGDFTAFNPAYPGKPVKETGPATGVFRSMKPLPYAEKYMAGYGYWGFRKTAVLKMQ